MEISLMTINNYAEVYSLWEACGISLGESDTKEEIDKFLRFNPTTCFIGKENGKIIANVLGGFDGRRGLVHHLCIHPDFRKNGYGSEIMTQLENAFRNLGVIKITFWVLESNKKVIKFYNQLGYDLRDDIFSMSKNLHNSKYK